MLNGPCFTYVSEEKNEATTLAEKLGAEVVVIEEDNYFATIIEYAKLVGATDIIMGKKPGQAMV